MTPLSALTSNPAPSPPPKFALGKCPATAIHVVSVLRPNRQRFCYEKTDAGDLIPHKCLICQPILTEKHISPYYAVYSDLLEDFVLFGYNTMTGKMEQFIYAFKTDCFVEVNRPEIKYNPAFLVKGNVVVALNGPEGELVVIERDCRGLLSKESTSYGQFRTLPTAALRTLTLQDLERDRWDRAANSDEVKISSGNESFDRLYAEYQKNLPRFQVRQCLHLNKEFLCVYSKTSGDYTRLEYIDETGDFQKISCTLCTCEVTESNLIPLYVERNASELVIHVHNTENNQIEQYIYDVRTFGFVQVKRNLVYDPKKITSGLNLFMAENIDNRKVYMIMRGRDGRLQKETSGSGGFEKMQPVAVKTFQVQWVEMKTEFEKKKASTERVEPQHPVQTEGEDIMETVLAMVESFNCDLRKELGLTQDQEIPRKAPRVESAETEENIVKNLEKLQIAKDPEEPTTAASEGGNTYGYQELDDTMSEGLLEKEAESKHQDANEPEPVKNVTYEPDVAAMDKKKKRRELKSRLNKINAQIDELEKRRMERAGKKQVVSSSVPSEEAAQVEGMYAFQKLYFCSYYPYFFWK